jgi:F-type H+-transporting ATPase subunit c
MMEVITTQQFFLGLGYLAAGLGAGIVVYGATGAIAKIVAAAVEGTARQPEAAASIKSNMQLNVFLIEGLGVVGLLVLIMIVLNLGLKAVPATAPAAPATVGAVH